MADSTTHRLSRAGRVVALGLVLFSARAWSAPDVGVVVAKSRVVPSELAAYAEVTPIAVAKLRAGEVGQVWQLSAVPGQRVEAGAVLGRLRGSAIDAELANRRAAADAARADVDAAKRILAVKRRMRSEHLTTSEAVYQAQAALARVQARLSAALAALRAAEQSALLHAPATGVVASVSVANGARVNAGETVLTVQPENRLWLRAVYYGTDASAVRVGMRGTFTPADGSARIRVEVASVLPIVQPGGGRPVGLRGIAKEVAWVSGEAGTVKLAVANRRAVLVPAAALILDRGRFWVLVHTPRGDERRAVIPGPRRGPSVAIRRGLAPGEQVVVKDAYLRFHHDFSQEYQPPD